MNSRQDGPYGVGGWLALLVAGMLVLGPLLGIGLTGAEFINTEHQYPALAQVAEWSSFKTVYWIAVLVFCAISIYGGLGLATKRTPDAVSRAKLVLWFNYPISIFVIGVIIPAVMIPDSGKEVAMAIPSLIASLIAVGIWTAYLNRSKRVRNTYGLTHSASLEGPPPVTHESSGGAAPDRYSTIQPQTTRPAPDVVLDVGVALVSAESPQQSKITVSNGDEEFWAKALAEYEGANRRPGLWARVFSEAQGNEAVAKANYLKHRAGELSHEHQQQLRAQQQAEQEAIEKVRLAKLAEEQRAYELLKGRCPSCNAVIPLASERCPKCPATFTGQSWKVRPLDDTYTPEIPGAGSWWETHLAVIALAVGIPVGILVVIGILLAINPQKEQSSPNGDSRRAPPPTEGSNPPLPVQFEDGKQAKQLAAQSAPPPKVAARSNQPTAVANKNSALASNMRLEQQPPVLEAGRGEATQPTELPQTTTGSLRYSDLRTAVISLDTNAVEHFLSQGVDINRRQGQSTHLIAAVQGGNVDMVKFLISKGADVNQPDSRGFTPIVHAKVARPPDVVLIQVLESAGATNPLAGR